MRSGVYRPSFATRLLMRSLGGLEGAAVVDVGCGSGVLAVAAALRGARWVLGIDVSLRAARTTRDNLRLNALSGVSDVVVGDGLSCVRSGAFDVIVCNPPMTPSPRPVARYTWGGPDGRLLIRKLLERAKESLRPGGRLLIAVSSLVGVGWASSMLEERGISVRVLSYDVHPFGRLLLSLLPYIAGLEGASILYIQGAPTVPSYSIVILEGTTRGEEV